MIAPSLIPVSQEPNRYGDAPFVQGSLPTANPDALAQLRRAPGAHDLSSRDGADVATQGPGGRATWHSASSVTWSSVARVWALESDGAPGRFRAGRAGRANVASRNAGRNVTRAGIAGVAAVAFAAGLAAGWAARGAGPALLGRLPIPGVAPAGAGPERRCATGDGGLMVCVHRVRRGRDGSGRDCLAADLSFVNLRRQSVTNICDAFLDDRGRRIEATVPMVAGLAPTDETEGTASLCGQPRPVLDAIRQVECHGLSGGSVSVPLPEPDRTGGRRR